MAGYPLPAAHAAAVTSGRQRLTLSAPRNNPTTAPHARVGDPVKLSVARHLGLPRRNLATRTCVLRARVTLSGDALVRVSDITFHERGPRTVEAEAIAARLRNAEQGMAGDLAAARLAVARLAGFRSWRKLYEWNAHRDRRGRPDADGRVTRDLIAWSAS